MEDLLEEHAIAPTEDQLLAQNQVDVSGHPVVHLGEPVQDEALEWVPKRRFTTKKPLIPAPRMLS